MQVEFTYPDKPVSSVVQLSGEFDDRLIDGETVNGVSTSMAIFTGTDANPGALLIGVPTFLNNTCYQNVGGGVVGNIYTLIFYVSTTANHLYQKVGYVAIIPDASPY